MRVQFVFRQEGYVYFHVPDMFTNVSPVLWAHQVYAINILKVDA